MATKKLQYLNINISVIYIMKVYLSLKKSNILYFDVDRKMCAGEIVSTS